MRRGGIGCCQEMTGEEKSLPCLEIFCSPQRELYSCGPAAESPHLHPSPVLLLSFTVPWFQGVWGTWKGGIESRKVSRVPHTFSSTGSQCFVFQPQGNDKPSGKQSSVYAPTNLSSTASRPLCWTKWNFSKDLQVSFRGTVLKSNGVQRLQRRTLSSPSSSLVCCVPVPDPRHYSKYENIPAEITK